jgi:hypothetical protein
MGGIFSDVLFQSRNRQCELLEGSYPLYNTLLKIHHRPDKPGDLRREKDAWEKVIDVGRAFIHILELVLPTSR